MSAIVNAAASAFLGLVFLIIGALMFGSRPFGVVGAASMWLVVIGFGVLFLGPTYYFGYPLLKRVTRGTSVSSEDGGDSTVATPSGPPRKQPPNELPDPTQESAPIKPGKTEIIQASLLERNTTETKATLERFQQGGYSNLSSEDVEVIIEAVEEHKPGEVADIDDALRSIGM